MSPNRLADEASPYLLQHADNPVDWYPWGDEALARARDLDKPILLSVGYAACHWCHVMAHESFEDEATAALMNEHFVSIKVDREERPDIDGIYMDAVQAMTGRGGWPMTAFLTPDGEPFYAGTYYPKTPSHGMPSFTQVLEAIAQTWSTERDKVTEQAQKIVDSIGDASAGASDEDDATAEDLAAATQALRGSFDPEWAGFGGAPKFPPSMALEFCLRMHLEDEEGALTMATETLHRMADGGMHDQVGGGFHRYSVDRFWHVPHFEKMLYDNAQLARVYLHAWQVTGEDRFRWVTQRTLDYLLREMRHPDGGFFSSQDADSEGAEGTFFVWGWEELVALVGADVATAFGARPDGNWEGTNVLWTPVPFDRLAEELGRPVDDLREAVDAARETLAEQRSARVRPGTDDKILTAWNGMTIAVLAEAGRILDAPSYLDAARDAATFVLTHLRRDGRLLRSWREGRTSGPAFADDHGLLAEGLLALYEATLDERWFVEARSLADALLELFFDPDGGGFFQTGSDAERLVIRPKDLYDNAVPSGNSAAADLLVRMWLFTGESRYEEAARSALRPVRETMRRYPAGFGLALSTADSLTSSVPEIAIAGPADRTDTTALADVVWQRYLPTRILAAGPDGEIPLLRDRAEVDGHAAAYVCERFVCQRPVTTASDLQAALAGPA